MDIMHVRTYMDSKNDLKIDKCTNGLNIAI